MHDYKTIAETIKTLLKVTLCKKKKKSDQNAIFAYIYNFILILEMFHQNYNDTIKNAFKNSEAANTRLPKNIYIPKKV